MTLHLEYFPPRYEEVARQKLEQLVAQPRGVLLTDDGLAGGRIVCAAAAWWAKARGRSLVTVLAPKELHGYYREQLDHFGVALPKMLTRERASRAGQHFFAPDSDEIYVIDQSALSYDIESALWKNTAETLRKAPIVFMHVRFARWPKALRHVELIGHMDRSVTFHASELDDAPAKD